METNSSNFQTPGGSFLLNAETDVCYWLDSFGNPIEGVDPVNCRTSMANEPVVYGELPGPDYSQAIPLLTFGLIVGTFLYLFNSDRMKNIDW